MQFSKEKIHRNVHTNRKYIWKYNSSSSLQDKWIQQSCATEQKHTLRCSQVQWTAKNRHLHKDEFWTMLRNRLSWHHVLIPHRDKQEKQVFRAKRRRCVGEDPTNSTPLPWRERLSISTRSTTPNFGNTRQLFKPPHEEAAPVVAALCWELGWEIRIWNCSHWYINISSKSTNPSRPKLFLKALPVLLPVTAFQNVKFRRFI